ncbi:hypothetical protein SADUNF_Sadunf19G0088000 [Salix dunnii]|uniref:Uncharacterized protein n=1 Tax=Salix dunnii TaxID=1413687 RepID=A0A835IZ52_9ROSI|nr:hypothetical protein SADUNF_Sadunf19G0088000 [Salix dunnii]
MFMCFLFFLYQIIIIRWQHNLNAAPSIMSLENAFLGWMTKIQAGIAGSIAWIIVMSTKEVSARRAAINTIVTAIVDFAAYHKLAMASNKVVVPFLLIAVLLLCLDYNNKVAAQSQCCTEHYELGKCIPGVDDKNPSGHCWKYCMDNCDEHKGVSMSNNHDFMVRTVYNPDCFVRERSTKLQPKEWDETKKEAWNLWEDMFLRSAERWLRVMEVDVPDLKDDSMDDDANEDGLDESNGVDSVAGGSPVLVLASRLHTGQKVLHVVSQESTQKAWNSAQGLRIYDSVNGV